MGELVQDRHDAALAHGVGDLAAEHVHLGERHAAGVLHGARIELGHEQLVVLGERVGDAELLLVIGEALLGRPDDVVDVEVAPEALTGEHAERNDAPFAVDELVTELFVRAGDERRDVGGDARRRLEPPRGRLAALVRDRLGCRLVRDDLPFGRSRHRELERRLQIRLLEHREHATRVGNLELRIEVHLPVDRVDEAVHALARVGVLAVGVDDELVALLESVQRDARIRPHVRRRELATVEGHLTDISGDEIDERRRSGSRVEAHDAARSEHLGTLGQVQRDLVASGLDDRTALFCLGACEVLSRHLSCSHCVLRRRPRRGRRPGQLVQPTSPAWDADDIACGVANCANPQARVLHR